MPEYDRSVTVTSDGVVTVARLDGTREQVGLLRPRLETDIIRTRNPHAPATAELDPSWSVTFTGQVVRTPAVWETRKGICILDPDGWRQSSALGPKDFSEPITEDEFDRRAASSTVNHRP